MDEMVNMDDAVNMDDYYVFDPNLNIDYGKSPQGNEVLVINSREIFRFKKNW
jgi:hypothetical protein